MSNNIEKFNGLKELLEAYSQLVNKYNDGLSPYAMFKDYLDRPQKITEYIDVLGNEESSEQDIIEAIMKLWATGGDIYVEGEQTFKHPKLIHSISNTTRLQVCIKNNKDSEHGKIINRKNLIDFAKVVGRYIKSYKNDNISSHNLVSNEDLKEVLNNNIDAAINELLFWYYYEEDKYPIINSRAKNSRSIVNQVFPNDKTSNDLDFINKCATQIGKRVNGITKLLMIDQLFYSIDEMKSLKKIEHEYSKDKENEVYKFYKKLWYTIKDAKIVSNADFFDTLLLKSKNIILYGAPGTGKTWTSENNIQRIMEENPNPEIDSFRFKKVQFHPSYSYEDFMEGLKPVIRNENIVLEIQSGDFMKFCTEAKDHEQAYADAPEKEKMKHAFFFLVDEINRAELSRVFGEIMYALDKRGNTISTQYSYMKENNKEFSIPNNLYFIGTMNDVDRSIDSFDIALRRRFFWYRMDCDYSVVFNQLESYYDNLGEFGKDNIPENGYLKACYSLNQFITMKADDKCKDCLGLGKLYELGHDYFLKIKQHRIKEGEHIMLVNEDLKALFEFSIEPLLKEYMRSEYNEDEIGFKIKYAKDNVFKLS